MFIVRACGECGWGETVEEAIDSFENDVGVYFDSEEHTVYEAKEIKVQRKFVVIEEQV